MNTELRLIRRAIEHGMYDEAIEALQSAQKAGVPDLSEVISECRLARIFGTLEGWSFGEWACIRLRAIEGDQEAEGELGARIGSGIAQAEIELGLEPVLFASSTRGQR